MAADSVNAVTGIQRGISSEWTPAIREDRSLRSRPQRFYIGAVLHYRVHGERHWRQGTTENISNSGVLFRGEEAVELQKAIEMGILLPTRKPGDAGAKVFCRGVVVRSWGDPAGLGAMMAVQINRSHLTRR